jgi:hypothetical protein
LLALARGDIYARHDSQPLVSVVRQRTDDLPIGRPTMPRFRSGLPRIVVHIEQQDDTVRCGAANCSALVPIPPPGRLISDVGCPRCGRVALPTPRSLELAGQSR